jgi:intracellular sulfur oxidation DsrE/DsrF family protein
VAEDFASSIFSKAFIESVVMSKSRPFWIAILIANVLGILSVMIFAQASHGEAPPSVGAMTFPNYPAQKVVYQVTDGESWLNRGYSTRVFGTAGNHVKALGAKNIDLRIVLAGDGIKLLQSAQGDQALRKRIDDLKSQGVKILVCRNTLLNQGIDPDHDLYDVKPADIVLAGVAEVTALQQQGFVYIRP